MRIPRIGSRVADTNCKWREEGRDAEACERGLEPVFDSQTHATTHADRVVVACNAMLATSPTTALHSLD